MEIDQHIDSLRREGDLLRPGGGGIEVRGDRELLALRRESARIRWR